VRLREEEACEVLVPDVRARVAAIELLLREGLGRPREATETPAPRLPSDPAEIERLSWAQIRALAQTHEPDLLRLELASMSDKQRDLLREALATTG
jgi:hypothetical protein